MSAPSSHLEQIINSLRPANGDYLHVSSHNDFVQYMGKHDKLSKEADYDEVVQFSDEVLKINKRGREQKRALVITNYNIYNFSLNKYKTPKRVIPIRRLHAVLLARTSDEVLLQIRGDYDYLFRIVRKSEALQKLSQEFSSLTKTELNVSFADDLKSLVVTKDDLRKNPDKLNERRQSIQAAQAPASGLGRRPSLLTKEQPANTVEGWLSKKGSTNSLWRRRYFHLTANHLTYYEAKTKGTIMIEHGAVHAWRNNRYNSMLQEAHEPQTPDQLKHILSDPDRRESFLAFCQKRESVENVNFYLTVEDFRKLDQAALPAAAAAISQKYLQNCAIREISVPYEARADAMKDIDSNKVTRSTFDTLQRQVYSIMRVDLLPQYLEAAQTAYAEEKHQVKKDLTEDDKKVESCRGCTVKFGLMKRRNICQYCNHVFCSSCITRKSMLPAEFNARSPVWVCDICYGVLNQQPATRYAFTYSSFARTRPLNLAAETSESMTKWIAALQRVLSNSGDKAEKKNSIVHQTFNDAHQYV